MPGHVLGICGNTADRNWRSGLTERKLTMTLDRIEAALLLIGFATLGVMLAVTL